jgi:hypothetical protein
MTGRRLLLRLGDLAFLALLVVGALTPIRSYDYFWHLATGRWIVEHRALPLTDPFAVASDRVPWINGEWLFEAGAYMLHAAFGDAGIAVARSLLVGGLFFLLWKVKARSSVPLALLVTAVAFTGAVGRLDARPSTLAAALLVAALLLLLWRRPSWSRDIAFCALTIVWINVHPSALLAPLLAAVVAVLGRQPRTGTAEVGATPGSRIEASEGYSWLMRARAAGMSALALLVNPWGSGAIEAPIRLAAFARGGTFVNAEWLPSSPMIFPLLYLTLILGLLLFAARRRWREDAASLVLLLFFGFLAVRFVRNQGLYFASFPLLVPLLDRDAVTAPMRRLVAAVAVAVLGWTALSDAHRPMADSFRFPVAAVDRLVSYRLAGTIYNPDQFGGYLIWRFYPQRRVLTDGRNELYRHYIAQYARARLNGRAWHALLDQYDVALAVDEYHRERMTVVDAVTGRSSAPPASQIYFPRTQWALVAFDDVGMVFARRSRFPPGTLAALVYRILVPDDEGGFGITEASRAAAAEEVRRAEREIGDRPIVLAMAAAVTAGAHEPL